MNVLASDHPIRRDTPDVLSRKIRVLIITARFLPDLGGTETHVHEMTRRMAARGDFDLTVLTTDRTGTRANSEKYEGFSILRCRSYPRNRDCYFAPGIYTHVSKGGYDLIHCQGIHTAVPVLAMIAARRTATPYLVTFHTGGHSSSLRRRLRNTQWRALGPLLRGAAAVVAVSRFEERMFQEVCRLDASRLRIIQNGGDLPVRVTSLETVPGRIVSSGRLERYKGHQRVIEALPIVQQSVPHATLHILGSGRYEGRLRALIDTLGLDGSVIIESIAPDDREQMAKALGAAGVVAAMSEYEAHPIAIIEALALGIPAVGLATAGIGDLVDDGLVSGVPVDASPEVIARALVTALDRQGVGNMAELRGWDAAASDLAQVYIEVAGTAPGPASPRDP
jgi:glycosyltransferase involved in cell wall biosynthesis